MILRIAALTLIALSALPAQTTGPASGSLVIVGGGLESPKIWKKFIELAGGPDAPIVVIPTAGGAKDYGTDWSGYDRIQSAGIHHFTLLHTYDRAVADTDEFVEPIRKAKGVWFTGGRQWRLADAYLGTKVEQELHNLLDRGGVIGGSSAGATIQGSYLARGDTKTNEIMMGDHDKGFGFIQNIAIDQHLLRRNRQFDLLEIIHAKPELLGVGIDEDTAIVVQGNQFEVIGKSYVAIYDVHQKQEFVLLEPGDKYDMTARSKIAPEDEQQ